jgi:hypothetical protein
VLLLPLPCCAHTSTFSLGDPFSTVVQEGTPKSKLYPSCQSAPDTAEVHVTSFKGSVATYLADDITGFQLCQGTDDGQPIPDTCAPNEYKDPLCASTSGVAPSIDQWTNVPMDSALANFDIYDEPLIGKPRKGQHPNKVSSWSTGKGYTKCASDNSHRLARDTCPFGYCAADHRNRTDTPWDCCSKCPGGTNQCLDNCKCRCTKTCTAPDPTPVDGGKCNCGMNAEVRYGNGECLLQLSSGVYVIF